MPRSKKGRLSCSARQEINTRRSNDIINGYSEGMTYARITKITGANHARGNINCRYGAKEISLRIPNIYARRGATPITTRDVVAIYVGTDFNADEYKPVVSEYFDITAILTSRQIEQLIKGSEIPAWMAISDVENAAACKKGVCVEDEYGFEFDHSISRQTISEEDSDDEGIAKPPPFKRKVTTVALNDDDDDVDIDNI